VVEHWEEFLEVALEWPFLSVALAILLVTTVGAGLLKPRWHRSVWAVGLVLFGFALYFGVSRHEWGEVLFNGQLL